MLPTVTAVKPYHHGNLRSKLIETAVDIVRDEGIESVTLRALAARIGVSHAAPYRHFSSKKALLAAIATEGFRMMSASQREWLERAGSDPLTRLRHLGSAYIDFAQKYPEHFRIMFGREIGSRSKFPELLAVSNPPFNATVECVRACQQAGILRNENATDIGFMLWSAVHGLTMLAMDRQIPFRLNEDPQVVRDVGRMMTDAITTGFMAADTPLITKPARAKA